MYSFIESFIHKKFNIDASYFLRGGFWLSLTQLITIIGGLLTSVLFAHYLAPQDFGIYRYLIGLSALVAAFSLTGLSQSILQMSAKKYYGFYLETIRMNLLYSSGIFFAGISGFGYYFFNGNTLLAAGCLCIAFLQPIITSFGNTSSFLQGQERYRESTRLQLVRIVFTTLASVTAILLTRSVIILFATFLLSNALINFLGHSLYKPNHTKETPLEILRSYKSYAVHTSLRNIISTVAFRADSIIVFTQLGAVELAIYTIANLIPEQIKGSIKNMGALLLSKYSKADDTTIVRRGIWRRTLQLLSLLILITVLYIIAAPFIYHILFPKYESAVLYSQLLALSFPAMAAIIPFTVLKVELEEKKLYKIEVTSSCVTILTSVCGAFLFGVIGVVVSRILIRYINLALGFFYLSRT